MSKKTKAWSPEQVVLVPHQISKERQKLLLTELAKILYDLSCELHGVSSNAAPVDKNSPLKPSKRKCV